eukprot:GHVU01036203.1.p4 GENE.GHVU01036203.1~~GHVU01036203.1.p4  ORF type:complete len:122 (+),score=19.07 GHVU01036203.1:382-747(+)
MLHRLSCCVGSGARDAAARSNIEVALHANRRALRMAEPMRQPAARRAEETGALTRPPDYQDFEDAYHNWQCDMHAAMDNLAAGSASPRIPTNANEIDDFDNFDNFEDEDLALIRSNWNFDD